MCGLIRFLQDTRGTNTVEYLVLAALAVAVVGVALYSLFESLRQKIVAVNNSL